MSKQAPILVADDDSDDIFLLRRAFEKAGLDQPIFDVSDGEQAIEYLSGESAFADRARHPLPALVVLDIKMPKRNGFDVLEWLSAHEGFRDLPVVMLSSSSQESDVAKARTLGAQEYFVKPSDSDDLRQVVQTMAVKWLAVGG